MAKAKGKTPIKFGTQISEGISGGVSTAKQNTTAGKVVTTGGTAAQNAAQQAKFAGDATQQSTGSDIGIIDTSQGAMAFGTAKTNADKQLAFNNALQLQDANRNMQSMPNVLTNEQNIQNQNPQLTGLEKVGNVLLKPSEMLGKGISAITGKQADMTSEQFIKTGVGKAFAGAIAIETAFAVGLIGQAVATTIAAGGNPGTINLVKASFNKLMSGSGNKIAEVGLDSRIMASNSFRNTVNIAANPKTTSLTKKIIIGAGFSLAAYGILKDFASAPGFSQFQNNEGYQALAMAEYQASELGTPEGDALALEVGKVRNEYTDWQKKRSLLDKMPWISQAQTAKKQNEMMEYSGRVMDKIIELKRLAKEQGKDPQSIFRQEQLAQDQIRAENFQKQLLENTNLVLQLKEDAANARDEQERANMEEQAEFWTNYRAEILKMEEASKAREQQFWLDIQKQYLEIKRWEYEQNAPSNLKFGLL